MSVTSNEKNTAYASVTQMPQPQPNCSVELLCVIVSRYHNIREDDSVLWPRYRNKCASLMPRNQV